MFDRFLTSRLLLARDHQLDRLAQLEAQLRAKSSEDRSAIETEIDDAMDEIGRLNRIIQDRNSYQNQAEAKYPETDLRKPPTGHSLPMDFGSERLG